MRAVSLLVKSGGVSCNATPALQPLVLRRASPQLPLIFRLNSTGRVVDIRMPRIFVGFVRFPFFSKGYVLIAVIFAVVPVLAVIQDA